MLRKLMIAAITSAALSIVAVGQGQFGTAAEAKAMLEKAVTAVKADKAKTLDQMQKGEGGFKDRDLYAFCANSKRRHHHRASCSQGQEHPGDQRQGRQGSGRRNDEGRD
jgi:hypothetical protein